MKIQAFILEDKIIFYSKLKNKIEAFNIKGNTSLKFYYYDYYEIFEELKEKLRIENKINSLNDSIEITFYYRNRLDEEIEKEVINELEYERVKVKVKEFKFDNNKTYNYELYYKSNELFLNFLSKEEVSSIIKNSIFKDASKVLRKNKNKTILIDKNNKNHLDEDTKLLNTKKEEIYFPYELSAIITKNDKEYLVPQNSLSKYVSNKIVVNNLDESFAIYNWTIEPSNKEDVEVIENVELFLEVNKDDKLSVDLEGNVENNVKEGLVLNDDFYKVEDLSIIHYHNPEKIYIIPKDLDLISGGQPNSNWENEDKWLLKNWNDDLDATVKIHLSQLGIKECKMDKMIFDDGTIVVEDSKSPLFDFYLFIHILGSFNNIIINKYTNINNLKKLLREALVEENIQAAQEISAILTHNEDAYFRGCSGMINSYRELL